MWESVSPEIDQMCLVLKRNNSGSVEGGREEGKGRDEEKRESGEGGGCRDW